MLTLAVIRTPKRVLDHFALAHRDGGAARPAATWFGKDAALEDLRDPVDPACLLPLLAGRIDETTLLGRGKGDNRAHRPGWEPMFSAPKSTSLVALAGGDERLMAAHDRAVKTALSWLEAEAACTRLRAGGKPHRHPTRCFLAVIIRHELSRAAEPHLHSRALLINTTLTDPGRCRSLDSMPLYRAAMQAGIRDQQSLAEQALACGYGKQRERVTRQAEAAQRPRSLDQQRQQDRHRVTEAGIDLATLVARARQRAKAPVPVTPPPAPAAIDGSPAPVRATGC